MVEQLVANPQSYRTESAKVLEMDVFQPLLTVILWITDFSITRQILAKPGPVQLNSSLGTSFWYKKKDCSPLTPQENSAFR